MSIFNDSNSFRNVGIKNSNNELIVMNINASTNNLSFHSSTSDNNVDIMNIKTILNKDSNNDLNLSSFDGSSINPVIQINNITQNVNIYNKLGIGIQNLEDDTGEHLVINATNSSIRLTGQWTSSPESYHRITGHNDAKKIEFNYNHGTIIADNKQIIFKTGDKIERMKIDQNGAVTINKSLTVSDTNVPSDDRLKINEVPITNAIDTINKLQPEFYTKISPTSNSTSYPESGLIAQDTYNNAPELRHLVTISDTALNNSKNFNEDDKLIENVVDENGNPSYLSLNYIGIIPYLTGAVKEMKTLIDTQNSKINNLESENNQLKLIIDKLKSANSFIDFKNSL